MADSFFLKVGIWLEDNKTWVFSGVGVALSSFIISQFSGKIDHQKQSGSSNIQAGGNVTITLPNSESQSDLRQRFEEKTKQYEEALSEMRSELQNLRSDLNRLESFSDNPTTKPETKVEYQQKLIAQRDQLEIKAHKLSQERLELANLVSLIFSNSFSSAKSNETQGISEDSLSTKIIKDLQVKDKQLENESNDLRSEFERISIIIDDLSK